MLSRDSTCRHLAETQRDQSLPDAPGEVKFPRLRWNDPLKELISTWISENLVIKWTAFALICHFSRQSVLDPWLMQVSCKSYDWHLHDKPLISMRLFCFLLLLLRWVEIKLNQCVWHLCQSNRWGSIHFHSGKIGAPIKSQLAEINCYY